MNMVVSNVTHAPSVTPYVKLELLDIPPDQVAMVPRHGRRQPLYSHGRAGRGPSSHLRAVDRGNRRVSDKRPPPSREDFARFVSRILAVPKEKIEQAEAGRRERKQRDDDERPPPSNVVG